MEQRLAAAKAAAKILSAHEFFKKNSNIAIYLARDDEFEAKPIIEEIWRAEKKCFLPVLSQVREKVLDFARYESNDVLQPNRYQILEPKNTESIATGNLDVVLMPLVGFDLRGNRLGMGGGYYDRTFEFLLGKKYLAKPLLIGLAYALQQVDELPRDNWDVPLDGILTEKEFVVF